MNLREFAMLTKLHENIFRARFTLPKRSKVNRKDQDTEANNHKDKMDEIS